MSYSMVAKIKPYVVWFKDIDSGDVSLVGGKGANLGEMTKIKVPVPTGFCVTSPAYFYFLEANNLREKIRDILSTVDVNQTRSLNHTRDKIQKLILEAPMPNDLKEMILDAYRQMPNKSRTLVAVRSSATAEDLPGASFAGQQATFLNVLGEMEVLENVQKCWASLFESRAIFYRQEKGFDHFQVGIAVPVQQMIQSSASGVMFTVNPVNNDKMSIVVESIFGLGELIVQGSANPDHFEIDRRNWRVIKKTVSDQDKMMAQVGKVTEVVKVPENFIGKQKVADEVIIELAKIGQELQDHYKWPQDVEWAYEKGKIYIVQTRPITTQGSIDSKINEVAELAETSKEPVFSGSSASPGVVTGVVKILKSAKEIDKIKQGDILVTEMTTPDYVPAMKRACAILTDKGGQTSHAAIVSRELGVPCIVGTLIATKKLKNGMTVTVDANKGHVYLGKLDITHRPVKLPPGLKRIEDAKTNMKVFVNLGEPEEAFRVAHKYVDGVGLLRAEFIISEYIGIHPKKILKDKRENFFINKLAEGLEEFCRAFYPRPVIYRFTDFKSNEYKELEGGEEYETYEPNPMLGYRGCGRYIEDKEVFRMEVEAIKMVRNDFVWKNLHVMVPFVRSVQELKDVKKLMGEYGLKRHPNFQLYMMAEIPNNVIQIENFIEVGIDGISIGSNDLTMLMLGVDRDNEKVAHLFDIHDEGVLAALEKLCKAAKKYKINCSICGQAPSIYPDITEKLARWGATSVSVSPDMIDQTRLVVHKVEEKLKEEKAKKKD